MLSAGYTPGMKTAVSIPDEIFEEAERLAERLRTSRSRLYSQALREYVRRHTPDQVTESINRVIEDVGTDENEFNRAAARRVLRKAQW
jgi:metal-responsive CopG/Arc/MetJ family transcriptional regulator